MRARHSPRIGRRTAAAETIMPQVLAHAITRLVYESETESRMRDALWMALHADQYGYDGVISELVADVCRRLREVIADERDPEHKARLERALASIYELV